MAGEFAVATSVGMAVTKKSAPSAEVGDAGGGELVHLLGGDAGLDEGGNVVEDSAGNGTGLAHGFEIATVAFENH